jgi:glutamate synthase domain-containing protein 2/glutamate synthase domain-containing protein 1/glutamate synthase domain-containing protein 3
MAQRTDFRTLAWPHERDACGVGFIADIAGRPSHDILAMAITALKNLAHRGAVSSDGRTGDGAGVLTQIPYRLFRRVLADSGVALASDDDLAVGVFFVDNRGAVDAMYRAVAQVIEASPLKLLMWRDPPVDEGVLGDHALLRRPVLKQVLLQRPAGLDDLGFERTLYLTRKRIETRLREIGLGSFYVPSFSSRTLAYKGLMVADQLSNFYLDLADPDYDTAIALFHQRYSTNTVPRWSLAQPFRFAGHNGEINTLQGNVNIMQAREPVLRSDVWGPNVGDLLPIIPPGASDSSAFDNVFELLALSGRDPIETLMMMVPEAYHLDDRVEPELRAFYEYQSTLMEPWDGPAALALTDGRYAIAGLDRNGLRPQRYWVSDRGIVVVASEAGVVPFAQSEVVERGRLGPGMLLAVDTAEQRLLKNDEIKATYARMRPYQAWLDANLIVAPRSGDADPAARGWDPSALLRSQKLFGYSREDYDRIFEPMVFDGQIPVGSMGDDTPLAVLSELPQQPYRYFKQRFAQVTNPPIDPLRERLVMSLDTVVGPRGRLLEEEAASAHVLRFSGPLIDEGQFAWLTRQGHVSTATFATRFAVAGGPEGLEVALERLCDEVEVAVRDGVGVVILSDREVGAEWVPISMFLATAAVHHRLLRVGRRTRTAIVCDTGEPREDHHYACLIGYGAALVHPYLAFATARHVPSASRRTDEPTPERCVANYITAIEKGLLKIMSKMGISTISSYRAAQIFEAVGVDLGVIDRYFTGTPGRIGGATLESFAADALRFHAEAYGEDDRLRDRGLYRFRKAGEYHALNPLVFKALHRAVRSESFEAFQEYARLVDERPPCNLRDLIEIRRAAAPLQLDEVEPIDAIVHRFSTQAMSHGSVSREAHETLAIAMNRLGAKSNSGEGGEDASRFARYDSDRPDLSHAPWHPQQGDWANSAIKQVASGRFGVTADYLVSASEIEIKMAQGSKPGEGGQIPGHKVNDEIARIRRSVPGVTLISPPPHHDIYSIEDLAQLIYDLKRVNTRARIGVKLVATAGVGTIAAGVAKGYADNIQISGHDGGTGASPLSSVKHAGVPWELGLAETQQVLVESGLRGKVTLRVDGGLKTGRDVVIGALLGAEAFGFGTAALVSAGCAMIRQCHLNTCPVGVATQRADLRAKYAGEPEHVVNFMTYVAQQVRMILAEMGYRSLDEIVGRVDLLRQREVELARAVSVDLSAILHDADPSRAKARRSLQRRNDRPEGVPLDEQLWRDLEEGLGDGRVVGRYPISNRDRSVGARLAGEIARMAGASGFAPGSVRLTFEGVAGQSFGVFNHRGMHLLLEGEAQDYVGKGMSGGEIVVRQRSHDRLPSERQTILGNTVLYGATGGSLFAAGQAGERLCVRNSGARTVVEGCGDHGCEYMTGGVAVVLGATGRNFGAGMSGGVAYVLDGDGSFRRRLNSAMVQLERIEGGVDELLLRTLIERHCETTGSAHAQRLLDAWPETVAAFWKVAPKPSLEGVASDMGEGESIESAALRAVLEDSSVPLSDLN